MTAENQSIKRKFNMKLHELVRRTYDKILKPIFKVEVLSDKGWEEIDSLNIAYNNSVCKVILEDDSELICSEDHILIDSDNEEVFAKDCLGKQLYCEDKHKIVKAIQKLDKLQTVYDLSLKGTNHLFYVNNILSHNCLMIDEMAFIPKNIIQDFWASVIPIVSSSKNSKIIVVSTPNGADGLYYQLWQQANSKNANSEGWKPFRIHWWEAGEIRDEKWKQQQIASIGLERWKQEFECDFLTSTTKRLIPDDILEKYRMELGELRVKNKEFLDGKKQKIISDDETKLYEFTMWYEFQKDKTYAASGDIAAGNGGDSSVLYIWDITHLNDIKLCAKFDSDRVSIPEFAFITTKMLKLYGNPYYICERNGVGTGYIDVLRYTYQYEKIVTEGKNNDYGVFSHVSIKSKACLWTRDMMTTQGFKFTMYDKDLINEMSTFVKKDTRGQYLSYVALNGAHDDHIMSFVWLCYLLQSDIIERYYIVCETFKDSLGNTYAKTVLPQEAYNTQTVQEITKDPLYKDFLDFKEQVSQKIGAQLELEKKAAENDEFQFSKPFDPYFNDFDTASWNSQQNMQFNNRIAAQNLNPNNKMPSFFIM